MRSFYMQEARSHASFSHVLTCTPLRRYLAAGDKGRCPRHPVSPLQKPQARGAAPQKGHRKQPPGGRRSNHAPSPLFSTCGSVWDVRGRVRRIEGYVRGGTSNQILDITLPNCLAGALDRPTAVTILYMSFLSTYGYIYVCT